MPRTRFMKMDHKRKHALLDAAAKEFARHGFESASVNRILAAAGFSKGSFYYYFDVKADLVATVLVDLYLKPLERARRIGEPKSVAEFWRELEVLQVELLDLVESEPQTYALMIGLASSVLKNPALLERLGPQLEEWRRLHAALWSRGQALGAVRDDLTVDAIMSMLEALKRAAWAHRFAPSHRPSRKEVDSFAAHFMDLVRRLVQPEVRAKTRAVSRR
jgi:AcrR family transcriptional regulator